MREIFDELTSRLSGPIFVYNEAVTTEIETVVEEVENNAIYDLTGRRVNEISKAGVYVVNGKKILVK